MSTYVSFLKPIVTAIYGCSDVKISGPIGISTFPFYFLLYYKNEFFFSKFTILSDCSRGGGDTIDIFGQHFGFSGSTVIIGSQVGSNIAFRKD